MKKIISISSTLLYFLSGKSVFAKHEPGHIEIERPKIDGKDVGFGTLGNFVQNTLALLFIVAILIVLFMIVWGAFEWITSGGDKDHVAAARNRIINALVGLAVLAIAFALFQVAGQFLGFNVLNFKIPTPQ